MSEITNRPVSEVVGESESSLIFVVYPQAIATMNYSTVWSLIFFLMLITLGIDSTVCLLLIIYLFEGVIREINETHFKFCFTIFSSAELKR